MKEGTAPAPPFRFCAESITYFLFRCYRMYGGCSIGGGNCKACIAPRSVILFLPRISYKNRSIQLWCGHCYPTIYLVQWIPLPRMGRPRGGSITIQKTPALRGPDRLWGGSLSHKSRFSLFWCELPSCPFQQITRNCYHSHPLSGEDDRKDSDDKAPQKHTMKAYYSEETVARLKESMISRQMSIWLSSLRQLWNCWQLP